MTNYNSTIFSEYINMSESNVIKGQAWIKGDKLLQDQIVFLNNIPTENIVVLISNIWDNLLKGPKEGEPTAKTNGKGYFYWELEINSIDNESELVKFLVECPKPREEDFIESSEEASNLATYKDSSEWANYWYERYKTAMENADVLICLSTPGPDVIKKEWIKKMAKNPIVFTCANPIPEIWPWEAKEAGAAVVATGRSDFENQVNNSLGFPGVFRGTLDARATTITDNMCITAAIELASCIADNRIKPTQILPTMDDWKVYPKVAAAVAVKAIKEKVAQKKASYEKFYSHAMNMIKRSRALTQNMMKNGFIKKSK